LGWQVGGAAATAGTMRLACHDGDAACDADGVVDGTCTFSVGLCVNPPTPTRCTPGTVAHVDVRGADAAELAPAIATLALPVHGASACTPATAVRVAVRRRARMSTAARDEDSGRTDRDGLVLRCRRARRVGAAAPLAIVATTDFETGLLASVRVTPP